MSLFKVERKKEKLEDFKTAINSTVRSLTNSNKIEVSFGNKSTNSTIKSIELPELNYSQNKINFDEIRAIADSKSLLHRFSDNKILKKYEPKGNISKKLYKFLKKLDVRILGLIILKVSKAILKNSI